MLEPHLTRSLTSDSPSESARKIEARRKEASDEFIKHYKELKKTVALSQARHPSCKHSSGWFELLTLIAELQKQAGDSLEAAKELYAQLEDEREQADNDIDNAREPVNRSVARVCQALRS